MRRLLCVLALAAAGAAAAQPAAAPLAPPHRPKIGLVLSGGGARGLAHIGVLKVLEREHVPVDVIAGTSMGAIIGGLYAGGMDADGLEAVLSKLDWDAMFASRVERRHLSQRRKEEDFEIAPLLEIGMRDGELRAPLGALSGRGLESLLRERTLAVRNVRRFDALPIPFRAVATDMESGRPVVLDGGDLALALRASMSVPGLFAPTEVDGRILGDGGLVDNVPIDVARAMGADVVIVVNIGTPLSPRSALNSVGGLTAQMINILTEQNVQRSLATLQPADVLIAPDLGTLGSADFNRARELVALGERGAAPLAPRLAALALDGAAYAQWRAAHAAPDQAGARISFVRFEGTELSNPQRFASQLESQPGQPFDPAKAQRDALRLAATEDYVRADYRFVSTPDGDGLVFDLEDKPWGPNYFRIGLDLSTDFRGTSAFNLKISHNRHWLDANGSEWRNQLQIGQVPRWFTELYHPLNWTMGASNDWFLAGYGLVERRQVAVYNNDSGAERGRFDRGLGRIGIDLGQPWAAFGEVRIGLVHEVERSSPDILALEYTGPRKSQTVRETGLRMGVVLDQLDFANFPRRGYRVEAETVTGRHEDTLAPGSSRFTRLEAQASTVSSWGPHTLNAYARVQSAGSSALTGLGRYTLGGFHELSGYRPGQIDGNSVLFGRLTYYLHTTPAPLLTRGFFVGGTLEAGNAWGRWRDVSLADLRSGMSLFVGSDTGLGPLYLGLTYAPRGAAGLYLFIGRP